MMSSADERASRLLSALGGLVGTLVLLTVSAGFFKAGFDTDAAADATLAWPTVDGVVTKTRLKHDRSGDDDSWIVRVRYRYEVEGKVYQGRGVRHHAVTSFGTKARAEDWLARHAEGRTVKVHYDPADPSEALLYPGRTPEGAFLKMFGGFLLLIASAVGVQSVRRMLGRGSGDG